MGFVGEICRLEKKIFQIVFFTEPDDKNHCIYIREKPVFIRAQTVIKEECRVKQNKYIPK